MYFSGLHNWDGSLPEGVLRGKVRGGGDAQPFVGKAYHFEQLQDVGSRQEGMNTCTGCSRDPTTRISTCRKQAWAGLQT